MLQTERRTLSLLLGLRARAIDMNFEKEIECTQVYLGFRKGCALLCNVQSERAGADMFLHHRIP